MTDAIGNKIEVGALVLWKFPQEIKDGGLSFRVVAVKDSGLSVVGPGGPQRLPPSITLQIDIPINDQRGPEVPRGQEIALAQFFRLMDPRSQALADAALAGDGKPQ